MAVAQELLVTELPDSVSVTDNTTQVNIKWTSKQTGESLNMNTRTAYYWISINGGEEVKYSVSYTLPQYTTKVILDKTITVPHKDDGTGTISVRTEMETRISAGTVRLSKSIDLTTIPRASALDSVSCATNYFTGKITYKYTPKSKDFYTKCDITLRNGDNHIGVKTIQMGKADPTQQTVSITFDANELATIYESLPNTSSGTLHIALRTYSDEYVTLVGESDYEDILLSIPNDATTQPTVPLTLEAVCSLPAAFAGLYIQGKTRLKATIPAEGKYGASIVTRSVRVDGTTYVFESSYTSKFLNNAGNMEVQGYAMDSRGITGTASETINVIGYTKPKIMDVEVARCDSAGNPADNGTYLKIIAKRSYSPVKSNGVQKNFCEIRYRYKVASAPAYSAWYTILSKNSLADDRVETGALLNGALSVTSSYLVQVQAIDDIGEHSETMESVPTEVIHNHKTKNGWGFGKYCEGENLMDVGWDAHFHGEIRIGDQLTTLRDYILSVISEGG